jgi:signal peptidase
VGGEELLRLRTRARRAAKELAEDAVLREEISAEPVGEPVEEIPSLLAEATDLLEDLEAPAQETDDVETPPVRRPWYRRLGMVVTWAVLGFACSMILAITLPTLFGMRDLTVLSGSMEPTIHTGDVVVEREVSPLDVKLGDIISFKDPEDPSILITHRVQDMQVHDGVVSFVTKGDANTGVERWKISGDGTIGRVEYHVWRLGYLLYWIRGRTGRVILIVFPAVLLGAYELVRIWRPKKRGASDEAPA